MPEFSTTRERRLHPNEGGEYTVKVISRNELFTVCECSDDHTQFDFPTSLAQFEDTQLGTGFDRMVGEKIANTPVGEVVPVTFTR